MESSNYITASRDPNWVDAMKFELLALSLNNTLSLVPRNPTFHVIGSKLIFRLKYKLDGSIDRYKARLVAKGYDQQAGLDFHETLSHVVKHTTIKLLLSLAVCNHWCIHQIDISNAFLHGDLSETIYIEQPPGFKDPKHPNHVCRLNKSLYGSKQALRS